MSEERFDRLEAQISGFVNEIRSEVAAIRSEVAEIRSEVAQMKENTSKWDDRFETYQKANQSIVNLAFSLIASATVVTIASALFTKR
jgi:predicted  nucleic acid-binding Zn-ribbon protein